MQMYEAVVLCCGLPVYTYEWPFADDVGPGGGAIAGGAVADDDTAAQPAALAQAHAGRALRCRPSGCGLGFQSEGFLPSHKTAMYLAVTARCTPYCQSHSVLITVQDLLFCWHALFTENSICKPCESLQEVCRRRRC